MKNATQRAHSLQRVGAGAACLMIFLFCGVAWAGNETTATLTVTPLLAKPGSVLKFHAEVFYNPAYAAYNVTAGTRMRIFVSRSDFSWVSDKLDIVYPGFGSVHVDFANGFTIPANAASGQVYKFALVFGPWWQLSNIAEAKVLYVKKIIAKKHI